jgi:hypothetical protein
MSKNECSLQNKALFQLTVSMAQHLISCDQAGSEKYRFVLTRIYLGNFQRHPCFRACNKTTCQVSGEGDKKMCISKGYYVRESNDRLQPGTFMFSLMKQYYEYCAFKILNRNLQSFIVFSES